MANTIQDLLIGLIIFIVLFTVFRIFRKKIVARLKLLARMTETSFDDELVRTVEQIHPRVYDYAAFYFASKNLVFDELIHKLFDAIFIFLVIYHSIIALQKMAEYFLHHVFIHNAKEEEENRTALQGMRIVFQLVLWSSGIMLFLANLGYNVNSLIASLGIAGAAVALALQNILADLFSSFAIYFDKPFVVGDFVVVGADMGVIKRIGLKTTRIETLQGEELVISNQELTTSRIQNFKKMEKRRVLFEIGLVYETSAENLEKVPTIIQEIFNKIERADLGRVHFREFADFSLIFEIVYYHLSRDYAEYMDTRQEINFMIKREFEKAGLSMAFPTQTVHVAK